MTDLNDLNTDNLFTGNFITENMDVWTSAIKKRNSQGRGSNKKVELAGINKLRELIIELAVRGKLVQQNSNDEPASLLLEKIATEKTQLILDKKLKKQKKSPIIIDEEKQHQLPKGWEYTRIGNVGNIFNGNSVNARLKDEKYSNLKRGLPFIATKDVDYGYKSLEYENGILIPINEPKFKVAHRGAVLICAEGGSAGKKCGVANQDICFGNKLFANELFAGLNPQFVLFTYLSPTFFTQFSESMTGIIGGISANKFSELVINLPPLAEQHRIVAKVDELLTLCDQLEQQTEQSLTAHQTLVEALLNTLTQSVNADDFQESWQRIADHFDVLFNTEASIEQLKQTILQLAVMGKLVPQNPSDEPASKLLEKIAKEKAQLIKDKKIKKQKPLPAITDEEKMFELPSGWEWCNLEDTALNSEAGWSPKCLPTPRENNRWGVLKVSAVTWGIYNPNENKELPSGLDPRPQYEVQSGDFLISRANTAELVAKAVIVPFNSPKKLMMSDKIIRFVLSPKVEGAFITLVNNSLFSRAYYAEVAGGTSSSMKNVSREHIRSLVIALPPLAEQKRIVAKVDELMVLCDQLKTRLADAQTTQVHLADAIVSNALGQKVINVETKVETPIMKITTALSITEHFINQDDGILALLIKNEDGEADAKAIWNKSKFDLPNFYKQLKTEIKAGYINQPAKADFEQ